MKNKFLVYLVLMAAAVTEVSAQAVEPETTQPAFTYDDIAAGRFAQKSVGGLRSMADGLHYTVVSNGAILKYSYATGEFVDTLCNVRRLAAETNLMTMATFDDYQFSADESKILLQLNSRPVYRRSWLSDFAVYDRAASAITPLITPSGDTGRVRYAVFSPRGSEVAFVVDNNIYISVLDGAEPVKVTGDGHENHIINGIPDWVYEEEFGLYHALRWSPDGSRLAFLRFDESEVREFTIQYFGPFDDLSRREYYGGNVAAPLYPYNYTYKYPKAGEKNSVVGLRVYDVAQRTTETVDSGPESDQYIPHFDWTPGGELYFYRLNRLQNHLEVILCNRKDGQNTIYEEKSDTYIDNVEPETITFLPDSQRFIVRSEGISGYQHLYMYDRDKGMRYALTHGEWEVQGIVNVSDKRIWFTSNEGSPLHNNLWSIDMRGKDKRRLTTGGGIHRITASDGCRYYISYFSNAATPNTVTLHSGDGKLIRTLENNALLRNLIDSISLPQKEFFVFRDTTGGREVDFNCYIVKPAGFDPSREYPLLITQYSGPGSQQVRDRWSLDWEDALVQQGYVVACVDPRGTGGRGEAFKKQTYGRMGLLETEDHIAFARWMTSQPYIDSSRIGIYGWSYGGFMSLNCILKGADVFGMAISVAPVTSWRYYDTIYTERYNGLPQDNPAGYDEPSPINHAQLLEGNLLIIHGSADDNVHAQNTYKMVHELTRAGKRFDMMIYTDDNHSMMPGGRHAVRRKMIEYCLRNL